MDADSYWEVQYSDDTIVECSLLFSKIVEDQFEMQTTVRIISVYKVILLSCIDESFHNRDSAELHSLFDDIKQVLT